MVNRRERFYDEGQEVTSWKGIGRGQETHIRGIKRPRHKNKKPTSYYQSLSLCTFLLENENCSIHSSLEKENYFCSFGFVCFLLILIIVKVFEEHPCLFFFFFCMNFPKTALEFRYGSKPVKNQTLPVNYTLII